MMRNQTQQYRARVLTRAFFLPQPKLNIKMTIENKSHLIKRDLIRAFAAFDAWFDKDEAFHQYKPPGTPHRVRNIFEQVTHFTASVMNTAHGKGMPLYETTESVESDEFSADEHIDHLLREFKPNGEAVYHSKSTSEVRSEFRDTLDQCLCHLELASIGQGFRYELQLPHRDITLDLHQRVCLIEHYIKKQLNQLDTMEKIYRIQSV